MKKLMDRIFARFGQEGEINGNPVKLFFWSTNSTGWQNMERMFHPLGEVPRGQYAVVLPAKVSAAVGDTIAVAGKKYLVQKMEAMCLRTGPVYQWGLCVEKGSEDDWGTNGLSV